MTTAMTTDNTLDKRVDRSAAMQAKTPMLGMILDQSNAMLGQLGDKAKTLIIGSNAVPGEAFRPLEGYALEMEADAPFVPGLFNTQRLFRGVVILPLIPSALSAKRCGRQKMEKLWGRLDPCDGMAMFEASSAEALKDVNMCSDYMSLAPSHFGEPNTACLMHEGASGSYWLAVTTHMLPHKDVLQGEDVSTFLARKAAQEELTVSQAMLPQTHSVGKTMARWYMAQRVHRELLAHKLRYHLLKHFYPDLDVESYYTCDVARMCAGSEAVHMVTNMVDKHAAGNTVVYYSNMVRATAKNGAFVNAGPFKQSLWVNVPLDKDADGSSTPAGQAIAKSEKLGAVPFSVPNNAYQRMQYFERIAAAREFDPQGKCRDRESFADVEYCGNYTHLRHQVIKHHSRKLMAPMGMNCDPGCPEIGDLVWRHHTLQPKHPCCHYHHKHYCDKPHHACEYDSAAVMKERKHAKTVETYSPYEVLDYVRGFETEATRNSFARFGVNFSRTEDNNLFLTPLFCLADSMPYEPTLAALAIQREKQSICKA